MAYTFATIQTGVRNNVNNATANVTQAIDDAVNYLSNFFHLKKIDTSKSTAANQNYITTPTGAMEIMGVKIGDNYYDKALIASLEEIEDHELKKFYTLDDGKIYILPTPTAVATCKIWFKSAFTPMAGAGSTDVQDRLVPILIVLATWFFFAQMVSQTATARELFPDIEPDEMQKIADTWRKQFVQMLKITKKDK